MALGEKDKNKRIKAILTIALFCSLFSAGVFAFCSAADISLEQTYPKVPGIDKTIEEIVNQPQAEKALGGLLEYIIKLVFYIVLGICLCVLIAAGVLQMAANASGKVNLVSRAREMARNGFLGLGILALAFVVLLVINPQLVLFDFSLPRATPTGSLTGEGSEEQKVVLYKINPMLEAQTALESVGETIQRGTDYDDEYKFIEQSNANLVKNSAYLSFKQDLKNNKLFGFLFNVFSPSSALAVNSSPIADEIYKSELYLRQAELALNKVINVIEGDQPGQNQGDTGLIDIMQDCKCGNGKYHDEWQWENQNGISGYYGNCVGGLDAMEEAQYWSNILGIPKSEADNQQVCGLQCQDCGESRLANGSLSCDLREVRVRTLSIIDPATGEVKNVRVWEAEPYKPVLPSACQDGTEFWGYYTIQALTGDSTVLNPSLSYTIKDGGGKKIVPLSQCDSLGNKIETGRFIKAKQLELETALADLEGLREKFVIEQVDPLSKVLTNNSMAFLLRNAHPDGRMFENDFVPFAQNLPNNLFLSVETPDRFSSVNNSSLTFNKEPESFFEGLFNLFVKPALAYKVSFYDAGNFYIAMEGPIFSDEILKHNQFVYRESSRASLFSVLTDLSLERIEDFFKDCLSSAFGEANYQVSREQIDAILQTAIANGSADRLIAALINNIPALADLASENIADGYNAGLAKRLNDNCQGDEDCIKNNLSPDYISKTLLKTINTPVIDLLSKSDEFKNFLNGSFKSKLDEDLQEHLDTEFVKYYDAILNGALTTSIGEMTKLDKVMETKLTDVPLLGTVLDFVSSIDKALSCRISGCCRTTNSYGGAIRDWADCNFTFEKAGKECSNKGVKGACDGKGNCSAGPTSGHDVGCYSGETLKISGGAGQCCIQGLKQKIEGYSKQYVSDLVTKYTSGKVSEMVQDFREGHPSLFPQYSSIDECYKSQTSEGRFYIFNDETFPVLHCYSDIYTANHLRAGECVQLTPEQINQLSAGVEMPLALKEVSGGYQYECEVVGKDPAYRKQMCEGAHYCWGTDWKVGNVWDGRDEKDEKCMECQWIGQDVDTSGGVGGTLNNLKNKALAGLINFGEQFISALVETTLATAFEYSSVFIEDEIVYPLSEYFEPASQLYTKLKKVLQADIGDVLPGEVSKTLEMSIEDMTKSFCSAYESEYNKEENKDKPDEEKTFNFSVKLSWLKVKTGSEYKDLVLPSSDGKLTSENFIKFANNVCRLNKHLHTTVLEEAAYSSETAAKVVEALNGSLTGFLTQVCWGEGENKRCLGNYLTMTPAEILFAETPLKNINDLIKATPKNIICGETTVIWQEEDSASPSKVSNPASDCDNLFETKKLGMIVSAPQLDDLIKTLPLPKINKESLPASNPDFYRGYCYINKAVCHPLGTIFQSQRMYLGDALSLLINSACKYSEDQLGKDPHQTDCQGKCLTSSADPNLIKDANSKNCSDVLESACKGCSIATRDTVALSLFRVLFKATNSLEPFKKLYPQLASGLQNELYKAGQISGKSEAELQEIKNSQLPFSEALSDVFPYFLNKTLKTVLLDIPLGVVKPFETNGPTITGQSYGQNFLSRKPSQLLFDDVCSMIIRNFENDPATAAWSLSRVYQQERASISPSLPYTLESLKTVTLASVVDKILNQSGLPQTASLPYVFCRVQNNTPAEILGLDQSLMSFVRPKELQIMFQIIEDYLDPNGERPGWLTQMIYILNTQTALNILDSVGDDQLSGFLKTSLRKQIENQLAASGNDKPLIDFVCEQNEDWRARCAALLNLDGLKIALSLLMKPPIDFLPLIKSPVFPGYDFTFNKSLIDWLAEAERYPWLKEHLIDILGSKIGLDKALYEAGQGATAIQEALDFGASKTEDFIKQASGIADTALIEAPVGALSSLVDFISNKIASLFGQELAQAAASQMLGSCYKVTEATTACKSGEVLQETTNEAGLKEKQCCVLGQPAVCSDKCRSKPTEGCNTNEGEVEQNGKCCYALDSPDSPNTGCSICRLERADVGGKCQENEFEMVNKNAEGKNIKLCCQSRQFNSETDQCCSTVLECVNRKFGSSLDNLADMFAQGKVPLSSLLAKGEKQTVEGGGSSSGGSSSCPEKPASNEKIKFILTVVDTSASPNKPIAGLKMQFASNRVEHQNQAQECITDANGKCTFWLYKDDGYGLKCLSSKNATYQAACKNVGGGMSSCLTGTGSFTLPLKP